MKFLLPLLLLMAACSSSPPVEEKPMDEEAATKATDDCLAHPELAKAWGECNVKATIYDNMDSLSRCKNQQKKSEETQTLVLKIRLKPNGKVRDVKADQVGTQTVGMEKCLAREISKLKFAAPPKGVSPVIYFPFEL